MINDENVAQGTDEGSKKLTMTYPTSLTSEESDSQQKCQLKEQTTHERSERAVERGNNDIEEHA